MSKVVRKAVLITGDSLCACISVLLSFFLTMNFTFELHRGFFFRVAVLVLPAIVTILMNGVFRLYKSLWEFAGVDELLNAFFASLATSFFVAVLSSIALGFEQPIQTQLAFALIHMALNVSGRASYRILRQVRTKAVRPIGATMRRIMVVGAGEAGRIALSDLKKDANYGRAIVVVDDDPNKQGSLICDVKIEGRCKDIEMLCVKHSIDEIIVAIPSMTTQEKKKVLAECIKAKRNVKIVPSYLNDLHQRAVLDFIRDIKIEDLLGRDSVSLDTTEILGYIKDKTVLVTGGGGSIGSELCRQIAQYNPAMLLILDIYENNAYDLQQELQRQYPQLKLEVLIASVRDRKHLKQIFEQYAPEVVFHAAAHKHVPLMEFNPSAAVKNNVFGTLNLVELANVHRVKRFVLISTDKAVNPTNVMGATKRVAEMIVQTYNALSKTEFVAVRFGNVLGSNGSVVPLFMKQISHGGPVTVTHPDIIRYFMTIPEAAQLVLQAGALAKGGEIFLLDMGEPVKIDDLARKLILLSGFTPDVDIKIEYTGLRPGEKLYEELLLAEEETAATKSDKIFISKPLEINGDRLFFMLKRLRERSDDVGILQSLLVEIVPNYRFTPSKAYKDALLLEENGNDANVWFSSCPDTVNL